MKNVLFLSMIIALLLMPVVAAAADQTVVMEIKGMTCEVCTVAVKKALVDVPGVKSVKVSFDEKKAWVTLEKPVADDILNDAVKKAGEYEGKVIERK